MSTRLFKSIGIPENILQNEPEMMPDPTLDSCCQREIESNRKRNALETTLRAHDRVAQVESQRRFVGGEWKYNKVLNLLVDRFSFGSGCRCCYDPNGDGGEYELLRETRRTLEWKGNDDSNQDIEVDEWQAGHGKSAYFESFDISTESREKSRNEFDSRKGIISNQESSSDSDGEFDYLLDDDFPAESSPSYDLQARRRAELESIARLYEILRYHGYGVHRQMHPKRVFPSVGYCVGNIESEKAAPRGAVLHLYDAFSSRSVSLDFCLEDIASRYPGTKFVRSLGNTALLYVPENDESHKWKRSDLPILLALKNGKVVAFSSGLRDFSGGRGYDHDEMVEQRLVEQWLDHAGVLFDTPPSIETVCRIRPEEETLLESMMGRFVVSNGSSAIKGGEIFDENAVENDRYDCGVEGCNKTFFHEHIGVKNRAQDGLLVSASQVASTGAL